MQKIKNKKSPELTKKLLSWYVVHREVLLEVTPVTSVELNVKNYMHESQQVCTAHN